VLDIAGLRETMGQFLTELQRVNGQLVDTNRKLDRVIDLLKMLAEMQAGDSYTVDVPDGWLPDGLPWKAAEEGE